MCNAEIADDLIKCALKDLRGSENSGSSGLNKTGPGGPEDNECCSGSSGSPEPAFRNCGWM